MKSNFFNKTPNHRLSNKMFSVLIEFLETSQCTGAIYKLDQKFRAGGSQNWFWRKWRSVTFYKAEQLSRLWQLLENNTRGANSMVCVIKRRICCFKIVLFWIMRSLVLNLPADAESKLKIECQQSSNTDPKFIKIYQKLIVKIETFQAMKVA